uniref:Uncharacterized protein n=1 Tax=Arundo donax TaxID=35708 RepID=A0A0A8ZFM0_ARUDO
MLSWLFASRFGSWVVMESSCLDRVCLRCSYQHYIACAQLLNCPWTLLSRI